MEEIQQGPADLNEGMEDKTTLASAGRRWPCPNEDKSLNNGQ